MSEFVCLAPYVRHFSIGERVLEPGAHEGKKFRAFLRRVPQDVNVIVVTDEEWEDPDQSAYVGEHYDLAVLNPSQIYVRQDLLADGTEVDFIWLCQMFAREGCFSVFCRKQLREKNGSFYEKRREGTYGTTLEQYAEVIQYLRRTYGGVLPFFQMLIIKDMFHLFFSLGREDAAAIKRILEELDDDIICGSGCISEDLLIRILSLKDGKNIEEGLFYQRGKLMYHNLSILSLKESSFLVEEMFFEDGNIHVAGTVMLPLQHSDIEYFVMDSKNKRHEILFSDGESIPFLGEELSTRKNFTVVLPAGKKMVSLRFMYRYKDMYQARVRMEFGEQYGLIPGTRHGFQIVERHLIRCEKRVLSIEPLRFRMRIKLFFTFPLKSSRMYVEKKRPGYRTNSGKTRSGQKGGNK